MIENRAGKVFFLLFISKYLIKLINGRRGKTSRIQLPIIELRALIASFIGLIDNLKNRTAWSLAWSAGKNLPCNTVKDEDVGERGKCAGEYVLNKLADSGGVNMHALL